MAPFLLLLLLHESLAGQVCLTMTDYAMNLTLEMISFSDAVVGGPTCVVDEHPCYLQCTTDNSNSNWQLNGSNGCSEVHVTEYLLKTVYLIHNHSRCCAYMCATDAILPLVQSLKSNRSNYKEMNLLHNMHDACAQLFSDNRDTAAEYIKVENNLFHNIMAAASIEADGFEIYNFRSCSLKVVNISDSALNSSVQLKAPQILMVLPEDNDFVPQVQLPVEALQNIPAHRRIVGLVSYKDCSQFQCHKENIKSTVVRIEILGKPHLQNLNPPIQMIFNIDTHIAIENDSQLLCHYFDEEETLWKQDGCETLTSTNSPQVPINCLCNHTTAFSILLVKTPIAEIHWKILSYISYIGCGLSAFFTALSMVIYVFSRSYKLDSSISIHVSLSGALFLLNATFLLTEWGATAGEEGLCVFLAAFMHFSLLCSFNWMAIETLHLYLLFIKVYNAYHKHYLLKVSLCGWGIPGIIVIVCVGMKDFKQLYGLTEITIADTSQTSSICWITDDIFFFSVNLLYFTIMFIFNSCILVVVAFNICKMKKVLKGKLETGPDKERFSATCRSGLTVLSLTFLVGTTWGLAFLGFGYFSYPILYLFCILNSTQGLFIFLWVFLLIRNQRRRIMEDKMTSTAPRTPSSFFSCH